MKWKYSIGGSLLILLLLLVSPQTRSATAQTPQDAIIAQVNQFRAQQGLPPFTYNAQLTVAAAEQARFIGANNRYTHTGTGGSTPQTRANAAGYNGRVSENIVGGSHMTAPQALAWWQNSAPHYATITSAYYSEIGAGFATGSHEQNIYTIVVGRPSDAPPPVASAGQSSQPAAAQPAPIAAPPFTLAAADEAGQIVHLVREGQALWTLAAYYEVDLDYIYRINNLQENDFVNPGDQIIVQLADGVPTPTPLPTATPPYEHTVANGQTMWSIAALHNLSIGELFYFNNLNENSLIQPGDELVVRLRPGQSPPPTATPQLTHQITQGQTLWEIALRYGLTLDEILAFNDITETTLLQPGETLFVRQPATEQLVATPTMTPAPAGTSATETASPSGQTDTPTALAQVVSTPTATTTAAANAVSDAAATLNQGSVAQQTLFSAETSSFQTTLAFATAAIISGCVGLYLVLRRPNRR